MSRCLLTLAAAALLTALAAAQPRAATEAPPPPGPAEIAAAPSFPADRSVVATHYFYWYKWPDEHFFNDPPRRSSSNLRLHFPDDTAVSYESATWHRRQMEDMTAAGIDVALCVYWGTPNNYDKPDLRFSVRGLPPLVQALDELSRTAEQAQPPPRIGLFYDTSTLLGDHAFRERGRGNVDLRTPEGKDIFYRTIRDFFRFVPPRHWACLAGRPLVQLYESAFAAGHDQSTLDYVYEHFAADFAGRRPLIVAGPSWSFQADLSTGWGAALSGPIGALRKPGGAVQIGPGYDDSPVPGRSTPTRDRLGGGFYAASWLLALQARPRLVILETWSEMHEGTPICATLEDGRLYIDLTRRYADLLKSDDQPAAEDWATVVRRLLSAPASNRAGREFASRLAVELHPAEDGKLVERGLRLCTGIADGVFGVGEVDGKPCIRTWEGAGGRSRYLYFDIADPYYCDHRGTLTLRLAYLDEGRAPILVEYDSADDTDALRDRYKPAPQQIERTGSGTWETATITLPAARCANRQNGGADLRLACPDGDVTIGHVTLAKLPANYGAR
ncbi:MAG: DUF5010 domain-containing protein [Planctomycetota bacterium]